jgi:hypothetical protein
MKAILFACCSVALIAADPSLVAAPEATPDYVAHEWGTFTSVQGADGNQMEWCPFTALELPNFVYSLMRPGFGRSPGISSFGKNAFYARQRMETPVIYFYTEEAMKVDVAVDFPQGKITEWYPQSRFADEPTDPRVDASKSKRNALRWNDVALLPGKKPALETTGSAPALLTEPRGSHYYAARETDAVLVAAPTGNSKREFEKFLFYRGIGNFVAPLTVKTSDPTGATLLLSNSSDDELRHLFAYEVRDGKVRLAEKARLGAHEQATVSFAETTPMPLAEARKLIAAEIREALTTEGLYARESAAMVKTWDDSWLAEQGVRVLYVLPRAWTDRTLPLRIAPAPAAMERVMVGRAEIITPQIENLFAAQVEKFAAGDEATRQNAVAETRRLGLGRFGEPTLRRVLASTNRSEEFKAASGKLLSLANTPAEAVQAVP